jgi:uncharacterized protein involved in exopolysaccharide biosynthesis
MKEKKNYDFASTDLLVYIWEKRVPLIIISLFAAVTSLIVSLTIVPMFKSTVILFPTASASLSRNLLAENYSGRFSIYEIGEEEQAEQLLQVLNSAEIKSRLVEKYKLMEHYGIDPNSKFPMTQLAAAFKSNIRFKRTEYMSIRVEVMDRDPQMAADIANDIAAFTDTVYSSMLKQRSINALLIVKKEYQEAKDIYQATKDSLDKIRALGINNAIAQADRYHEAYGRALVSGNSEAIRTLEQKFHLLSKYGGTYDLLNGQVVLQSAQVNKLLQRLMEAQVEVEQAIPHKFVVDRAYKAEKKAYPKKSIIVIVSTLAAFLFGLMILILNDNLKKRVK